MRTLVLCVFGALTLTLPARGSHTLDEGIRMVNRGAVDGSRLVLKWKDSRQTLPRSMPLTRIAKFDHSARPLFLRGAETYRREREQFEARTREKRAHLENYQRVEFRTPLNNAQAIEILRDAYANPDIEFAYFEPHIAPANIFDFENTTNASRVKLARAPVPNYEPYQYHLDPAPRGVNAYYAWNLPGGTGDKIHIVDVEFGWTVNHEEFSSPFHELNGTSNIDHGTAVWGEVAAKRNGVGVTGIAYGSEFGVHRIGDEATYEAAAAKLAPGDVMILELQISGPDNNYYAPMEYWRAHFDAIKSIADRQIIVVAAAGNGNSNLDAAVYNGAFDLAKRDSGSIIVGAAGAPGANHLKRMYFSNYGSRVDACAYGEKVITTGYGDLYYANAQSSYTQNFSGTSSATPIVAGAVAAIQGMARAKNIWINRLALRDALRATGTAQKGNRAERIGNLPDIKQLHTYFGNF